MDLEQRLVELSGTERELRDLQQVMESELATLRTLSVTGRLDDSGQLRLDSLRDQVASIADELREIARLKKAALKELVQSRATEHAEKTATEEAHGKAVAVHAKALLSEAQADYRRSAARFAAVWGLANNEKHYTAAKPDLIKNSLGLKDHQAAVEIEYAVIAEEVE